MLQLGVYLFVISFLGFLGMTLAPGLVAFIFHTIKNYKSETFSSGSSIEILIPVHNQPEALEASLQSISHQKTPHTTTVGLNNCTDTTADIAKAYSVKTIDSSIPGKWSTLKALIENATGDWVVLMDSGTILPENFFEQINLQKVSSNTLGIAPRYFPKKLGVLQKVIWIFESLLKRFENLASGPVSVHGACVMYRRVELQKVMISLGETHWLNDDVVIPLWLRYLFPAGNLIYRFDICIDDFDVHSTPVSVIRRKRLVKGNLDWMTTLWPKIFKNDLRLFALSTRRVFRLVWAWWPMFFMMGLYLIVASYSLTALIACLILSALFLLFLQITKKDFLAAIFSSLFFFKNKKESNWK